MIRPASRLPAPKDATLEQVVTELVALSDWAKAQGYDNVYYRLNWALRAVSAVRLASQPPAPSSARDDGIRSRRAQGETLPDLADECGISKQRVHQICKE